MEMQKHEGSDPDWKPYEWLTEEHKRSLVRFFQILEMAERRAQASTTAVEPDSGGEPSDSP